MAFAPTESASAEIRDIAAPDNRKNKVFWAALA